MGSKQDIQDKRTTLLEQVRALRVDVSRLERRNTLLQSKLEEARGLRVDVSRLERRNILLETKLERVSADLKLARSQIRASNVQTIRLIQQASGVGVALDSDALYVPLDPELVRSALQTLAKRQALASPTVDALLAGKTLTSSLVATVRSLLAAGELYQATSFAHGLIRSGDIPDAAALCFALVAYSRKAYRTSYLLLSQLPRALTRLLAPVEFTRSAYLVEPQIAKAEVLDISQDLGPDLSGPQVLGIAQAAYGYGDRAISCALSEALLRDPRRFAELSAKEQISLEWFTAYIAQRASQAAAMRFERPGAADLTGPPAISIGVLDYKQADWSGVSTNVGDPMQTLAFLGNLARLSNIEYAGEPGLKTFLAALQQRVPVERRLGSRDGQVNLVSVQRDASHDQELPDGTWLIAYGWYMHSTFKATYDFPFHANLRPIFISFHLNDPDVLTPAAISYLKAHEPIGCRDWSTAYLLTSLGVSAFFSGCLTTTIDNIVPASAVQPPDSRPQGFVDVVPSDADQAAGPVVSIDRKTTWVREASLGDALEFALDHLDDLRTNYTRIVTSRLHCYLPCLALGVDVEFRPRNWADVRYDGLMDLAATRAVAIREPLLDKLAVILDLIVSGAESSSVYERWRQLCAPEVESTKARMHDLDPMPAPSFDVEAACRLIRSRQKTSPSCATAAADRLIDVAFSIDAALTDKLPVFLESMLAHTRRPIRAWIITRGVESSEFDRIARTFPDVAFVFLPCDGVEYSGQKQLAAHLSVSTMDRLLLPSLLTEVGRLIYLDVDTLALGDISELADLDLGGMPIGARAYDTGQRIAYKMLYPAAMRLSAELAGEFRRRLHARFDLRFPMLNAGVLVLDLDQMRQDAFCTEFIPYAERFGLNDQDVLGCYAGPRIQPLPPGWNVAPRQERACEPKLIHWAGRLKPWGTLYTLYSEDWQRYRQKWLSRLEADQDAGDKAGATDGGFDGTDEDPSRVTAQRGYREYWSRSENFRAGWNARAALAATMIRPNTSVLDLGCGSMALREFLPEGCRYVPADLSRWTEEVLAVDLENGEFPAGDFDTVVLLGVVEYLRSPGAVLRQAAQHTSNLIISFCHPRPGETVEMRRRMRWINDLDEQQLKTLFHETGWVIREIRPFGQPPASCQNVYLLDRQHTSASLKLKPSTNQRSAHLLQLPVIARQVIDRRLTFLSPAKLVSLLSALDLAKSMNVSGDFAEFGLALGGSAICIAHGLDRSRRFLGFDVFGMIPSPTDADGEKPKERYRVIRSGEAKGIRGDLYYGYVADLYGLVCSHFESFGLSVDGKRIALISGLFNDTLPAALPESIAFAHIDCDWYEPVKLCLESVYERLSPDGLIVLDDYLSWEGCRKATDEFCLAHSDVKVLRLAPHAVLQRVDRGH